jgi:hypothetical protein
MLQSQGLRAAAGRTEAVLTFRSIGLSSSTTSSSKSISLDIGTASSDRYVIVLFQHPASSTSRTISSATIAGVSATIATNNASTSISFGIGSFFAKVTAGSGAQTISVTLTGSTGEATSGFAVYTLTGRTTMAFSAQNQSTVVEGTSRTTTLTVPTNGFSLNFWTSTTAPTAGVWSGTPFAPVDQSGTTLRICSSGFENFKGSSQSVTATFSHSNNIPVRLSSSSYTYV